MRFSIKIFITIFLFGSITNGDVLTDKMYSFIGVQTSVSNYDGVTTPTFGIKYGKQTDIWRTAISYNYAEESRDKFQSLIIQMDRGILMELFEDIPVKPYLGFSLGILEHRNNKNKPSTDRGYLYGINTGVNYVVNKYFDVDFGYRYMDSTKLEFMGNRNDFTVSLHYYFD